MRLFSFLFFSFFFSPEAVRRPNRPYGQAAPVQISKQTKTVDYKNRDGCSEESSNEQLQLH